MERDPVLLANILHEIAKAKYDFSNSPLSLKIQGEEQDDVDYHLLLLAEAGLIVAETDEAGRPRPLRLTWKGHDYMEKSVASAADGISSVASGIGTAADEFDEILAAAGDEFAG